MAAITLRTLRRRARAKADVLLFGDVDGGTEPDYTNAFTTNQELNEQLNYFCKEYYNLIAQAEGEEYFRQRALFVIGSSVTNVPIPYDLYKIRALDFIYNLSTITKTFTGSTSYISLAMDQITIQRHRLHHGASCTISNGNGSSLWVTGTVYTAGDIVYHLSASVYSSYTCQTTHTAGTFATDLGNTLWVLVGALPTGIAPFTTYYIFVCGENIIKLCTSLDNLYNQDFINISAVGSGTNTITAQSPGAQRSPIFRASEDDLRNNSSTLPSIAIELSYIPIMKKLVDTIADLASMAVTTGFGMTDAVSQQTFIDGVNGLEEYIVLRGAMYLKSKQEEDIEVLASEFKGVKAMLEQMKEDRDSGQSDSVRDVRTEAPTSNVVYRLRGSDLEFVTTSGYSFYYGRL